VRIAKQNDNSTTRSAIYVYNSTQLNELQRTQVRTPQCPYLNNCTKYKTMSHSSYTDMSPVQVRSAVKSYFDVMCKCNMLWLRFGKVLSLSDIVQALDRGEPLEFLFQTYHDYTVDSLGCFAVKQLFCHNTLMWGRKTTDDRKTTSLIEKICNFLLQRAQDYTYINIFGLSPIKNIRNQG